MKHLFVPYQLAKLAKEKGLKLSQENVLATYEREDYGVETIDENPLIGGQIDSDLFNCVAPLYQQLVDWSRMFMELAPNYIEYCSDKKELNLRIEKALKQLPDRSI